MTDFGKFWLVNNLLIRGILKNSAITFRGDYDPVTGEAFQYPIRGKYGAWKFFVGSDKFLEITGSLHKYWHGHNGGDFTKSQLQKAIDKFCKFLNISPTDLSVHNLEFSGNICPLLDATDILSDIVAFKNTNWTRPISDDKGCYLQFPKVDYTFKIYDKARHLANDRIIIPNTVRIEVKATNSRYLRFANIKTMADLLVEDNLVLLGERLIKEFENVVFDDPGIDLESLSTYDKDIYQKYNNPRAWTITKKKKNSTIRTWETRFKTIIKTYGKYQHSEVLSTMLRGKWGALLVS
jgi:hypothetical protein